MREGDQGPLWAWFWMNQGMTILFLQNRELLSWWIKISLNKLNPWKSISWIPPWVQDFTSLPVCNEISRVVPVAAKETLHRSLQMTMRGNTFELELWGFSFQRPTYLLGFLRLARSNVIRPSKISSAKGIASGKNISAKKTSPANAKSFGKRSRDAYRIRLPRSNLEMLSAMMTPPTYHRCYPYDFNPPATLG